ERQDARQGSLCRLGAGSREPVARDAGRRRHRAGGGRAGRDRPRAGSAAGSADTRRSGGAAGRRPVGAGAGARPDGARSRGPGALEVEVDLLTTAAVQVKPGTEVVIHGWGGDAPLAGRVRRVEPSGFTKPSALGVDEQRVNVLVALTDPPARWSALGDGYRVE